MRPNPDRKFAITFGKGFHMTFANGCTVSVQWGPGNYCNRREADITAPRKAESWEARTAETYAFDKTGKPLWPDVRGWRTADEVAADIAEVMNYAA